MSNSSSNKLIELRLPPNELKSQEFTKNYLSSLIPQSQPESIKSLHTILTPTLINSETFKLINLKKEFLNSEINLNNFLKFKFLNSELNLNLNKIKELKLNHRHLQSSLEELRNELIAEEGKCLSLNKLNLKRNKLNLILNWFKILIQLESIG